MLVDTLKSWLAWNHGVYPVSTSSVDQKPRLPVVRRVVLHVVKCNRCHHIWPRLATDKNCLR